MRGTLRSFGIPTMIMAINGFRNHDLRKWLYRESEQAGKDQQKKYSGRTTRRIKLLRTHGLIRKAPRANRYVLTEKSYKINDLFLCLGLSYLVS
ncbi:MAG TPA: hypothetical protein VJ440_10450 [Candidatus Brocadiaceae bacterium]|nr:hypothetical protein [Candidatus Brocadiaceae bacterium]